MAQTTTQKSPTMTPAEKAAATRAKNAKQRSTAAKKAAQTRAANRGAEARSTTKTKAKADASEAKKAVKHPVVRAGEMAEKALLVQVGAALIAREQVGEAVEKLRSTYSTRKKTENQLRRFERRGSTALKSIERDAKKTRTRLDEDVWSAVKDARSFDLVSARVENVVQSGKTAATKATTTVQERIASLV